MFTEKVSDGCEKIVTSNHDKTWKAIKITNQSKNLTVQSYEL